MFDPVIPEANPMKSDHPAADVLAKRAQAGLPAPWYGRGNEGDAK
jgi:hypothetical protein